MISLHVFSKFDRDRICFEVTESTNMHKYITKVLTNGIFGFGGCKQKHYHVTGSINMPSTTIDSSI